MSKTPSMCTSEHILNTIQMNLFEGFFIILMGSLKYQV